MFLEEQIRLLTKNQQVRENKKCLNSGRNVMQYDRHRPFCMSQSALLRKYRGTR